MSDASEHCPRCGLQRSSSRAGSLTQWIAICSCDSLVHLETESQPIQFCALCGKRITNERMGSLTQYIFRADSCRCEKPQVLTGAAARRAAEESVSEQLDGSTTVSDDDKELDDAALEEIAREFSLTIDAFPFKRYTPLQVIGKGACGIVYLAKDRLLQKRVAIKCLHFLTTSQLLSFQNEARAISSLVHDGIIKALDFGATTGGVPYLVMEYVDGDSLAVHLQRGRLSVLQSTRIARRAAEALNHAHEHGIFHRDIKPSNIILAGDVLNDPRVRIIDFGVARLKPDSRTPTIVNSQNLIGTPLYMAPEMVSDENCSPAAEVYSLGCVLFECLSGKPPFAGDSVLAVLRKHANDAPPSLQTVENLPEGLEDVVLHCLEKDPQERISSMSELIVALCEVEEELKEIAAAAEKSKRSEKEEEQIASTPASTEKKPLSKNLIPVVLALIAIAVSVVCFTLIKPLMQEPTEEETKRKEAADTIRKKKEELNDNKSEFAMVDGTYDSIDLDGRLLHDGPGASKKIHDWVSTHRQTRTILIRDTNELGPDELALLVKLEPSLLVLSKCNLTDDSLKALTKLPMVSNLTLDENPKLTARGLSYLSLIPSLGEVMVKNCDFDDETLKGLAKMKYLGQLDLRGNKKISIQGLKNLGARHSELFVRVEGCAAAKMTAEQVRSLFEKYNLRVETKYLNTQPEADDLEGILLD